MTNAATETQPAHTNRLIDATSPYLLQHAHNPVDWYPWGEEALNKARTEDKPIFLSIGYSACHWCHVMERESFENEKIAHELNQHFVPIKVDREERPDLDAVYMDATMLANQGQGGWPMSVFLTPDGKPFFAGTYFPPHSRHGMPGFMEVLQHIARLWDEDRDKITQSANALTDAVRQLGELSPSDSGLSLQTVGWAVDKIADAFDGRTGGILSGHTNKFPPSMAMSLMLRDYIRSKQAGEPKQRLIDLVTLTLDHMAHGGIYDHLGGGIARYSTDPQWLVPHFEKMLYDQALVSAIYLEGHQLTGKPYYADVARDIFDYVLADLHSSEGGFYSSRDADSEGVEGKYYVWSRDEIMEALGERNGNLFCSYYDVTEGGNWEGHNILNVPRGISAVARLNDVEVDDLKRVLADGRARLLKLRGQRVPPGLDDKVLTAWNGLMIASMARGGRILGDEEYVAAAAGAADFILEKMTRDGRLLRAYRAGKAHIGGYLDDYAFFVDGLLELYLATGDLMWLEQAERLNADMIEHFHDDAEGAFFFTADDAEGLFVRSKDLRDGAIPSGNSVAVMNLLRLAVLMDRPELRHLAEQAIRAVAGSVQQMPFSHERLLAAVDFLHSPHTEVVIVGPDGGEATGALSRVAHASYDPNRMVLRVNPSSTRIDEHREKVPLVQGRGLVRGQPAAYVCRNRTCGLPATSTDELVEQLSQSSR